MEAGDEYNRRNGATVPEDYSSLPPNVRLEDTIAIVDPELAPDPLVGRNVDQHRALRDD